MRQQQRLRAAPCAVLLAVVVSVACGGLNDGAIVIVDGVGEGGASGSASNPGVAGAADGGATSPSEAGAGAEPSAGGTAGGGENDVGGAAGTGGDGSGEPLLGLFVSVEGNDDGTGTLDDPFASLAKAASVATSGETIVFLDGTHEVAAPAVEIPAGVDLAAQNALGAELVPQGEPGQLLSFEGGSRIDGLVFAGHDVVVGFANPYAPEGPVTVANSRFEGCGRACLELTFASEVVIESPADAVLGDGGVAFAILFGQASLGITGGILQNYASANNDGAVLGVREEATLSAAGTTFRQSTRQSLALSDTASGVLSGWKIDAASPGLIQQQIASQLIVAETTISISSPGNGFCFSSFLNGKGSLAIVDSKVSGCGSVLQGTMPAMLTLSNTELTSSQRGVNLTGSGTARISDCKISGLQEAGLQLGSDSAIENLDLKVRGSQISGTLGLSFFVNNKSHFDLGTVDEPGNNTLLAPASGTALKVAGYGTVQAVGNTWVPSVQSADANGRYKVSPGLDVFEVAQGTGQNYQLPNNAMARIRLAERAQ